MSKQKLQPKTVQRIVCPRCGELQVKIYPWSSMALNGPVPNCRKCINKPKGLPF